MTPSSPRILLLHNTSLKPPLKRQSTAASSWLCWLWLGVRHSSLAAFHLWYCLQTLLVPQLPENAVSNLMLCLFPPPRLNFWLPPMLGKMGHYFQSSILDELSVSQQFATVIYEDNRGQGFFQWLSGCATTLVAEWSRVPFQGGSSCSFLESPVVIPSLHHHTCGRWAWWGRILTYHR
jgi:hypothetical protein